MFETSSSAVDPLPSRLRRPSKLTPDLPRRRARRHVGIACAARSSSTARGRRRQCACCVCPPHTAPPGLLQTDLGSWADADCAAREAPHGCIGGNTLMAATCGERRDANVGTRRTLPPPSQAAASTSGRMLHAQSTEFLGLDWQLVVTHGWVLHSPRRATLAYSASQGA